MRPLLFSSLHSGTTAFASVWSRSATVAVPSLLASIVLVGFSIHPVIHPGHAFAAENDCSLFPLLKDEQRQIRYRDPALLPDVEVGPSQPPPTVRAPLPENSQQLLSLDEAIKMALDNTEVVRQLAGNIAVASGRTIYDPAIANTAIDQQRAAFDPTLQANNAWSQTETPVAVSDPGDPTQSIIGGTQTENHNVTLGLTQRNLTGGVAQFGFGNDASREQKANRRGHPTFPAT